MTEMQLRERVVAVLRSWLGFSEANGRFRTIIDLYNTQKPLPRGYRLSYEDEWCAATMTAAGIKAGLDGIIYGECSCSAMIELYRKRGRWMEDDAYQPEIGDLVMYYWRDGKDYAQTDCTKPPNHVGAVSYIHGKDMIIIEGNKGEAVSTRALTVNGRYIRGYCLPDYAGAADEIEEDKMKKMKIYHWFKDMPDWARPSAEKAYRKGVITADPTTNAVSIYESNLQTLVILDRLGLLD